MSAPHDARSSSSHPASNSDPDYDSDSGSSLPELSQIIASNSRGSTSQDSSAEPSQKTPPADAYSPARHTPPTTRDSPGAEPSDLAPKAENVDMKVPRTAARQPSPRKTRSATKNVNKNTPAGPSESSPAAATSSASAKLTGGKKRVLESTQESADIPQQLSATQPSKRAKRTQVPAPPASQPAPRPTPSKSSATFAVPEPPSSSTTSKGKSKDDGKGKDAVSPDPRKSVGFWHLDGSTTVQVQNTLYRLHRSRLVHQSAYFAKLLEPDAGSKVYVVKGVSVLDFERLLEALDVGVAYAINPPAFPVLASLLRAAHTLQFETIYTFAAHLLRQRWPQDLSQITREPKEYAVETILLAHECDIPEVLKGAYYELLRAPGFGQDLAVYIHAESVSDGKGKHRSALDHETPEDEQNAPRARLAASDFVRLVGAKAALETEWLALARSAPLPSALGPCPLAPFINGPHTRIDKAKAAEACSRTRKADAGEGWAARLLQNGVFEAGFKDVFEGIDRLIDVDWAGIGYCVGCAGERREMWLERREKLWRQLDVLLGLKGEDE